ncbi:probable ATP-dependent RNA helicase DDX27 isoform X5 [Cherax quadricarinatus]
MCLIYQHVGSQNHSSATMTLTGEMMTMGKKVDSEAVEKMDSEALEKMDSEALKKMDSEALQKMDSEALGEKVNSGTVRKKVNSGSVRKKVDLEFGPGTIESGDEIDQFSGSGSDSENEVLYRADRMPHESDFYKDFTFVESTRDYLKDTWDEIFKYIKPKKTVNISETIAKIRLEEKEKKMKKEKKKLEKSDEASIKTEDDSECSDTDLEGLSEDEFLPDVKTKDQLKQRENEVKRKAKLNDEPVKRRKTLKEIQQEKVDAEFFEDAPPCVSDSTFLEMNFSRSIFKAIESLGYDSPTPIQAATIPVALQGRDICGCAATGTGKTAAYMLPILERLLYKPSEDIVTRVLVLVPTRELGVQVFQVSKELSKFSHIDVAMSVGGLDLRTQEAVLKKVPDIVIATPGRLIDHLQNTPSFSIDSVEILVLDEADRMLDDSFDEQMKEIIQQCSGNRQTMLFSATMTSKVKELALVSLKNPVKIFVNENTDVAKNLRQEFVRIRKNREDYRKAVLAYLVSRSFSHNCMVFVGTKVLAHHLNILLGLLGVRSGELHGNLKQAERLLTLKKFKDDEIGVLIATDVAARGLDIKGVKTVINYTLPNKYVGYVHRVGRTARAGHCGRCISLAGEHEFLMLKEIKKCSKTAMFERMPNKDVLEKYKVKLDKLKPTVERVLEEELEEKKLLSMEQAIKTMENKLAGNVEVKPDRKWFQTEDEIKAKKKKFLEAAKQQKLTRMVQKKKGHKLNLADDEERQIMKQVKVSSRIAKKASRLQRLNSVQGNIHVVPRYMEKPKKTSSKSSFDQELTRTDRKSIKKFRHGPSFQERKEAFQLKNPGKKFRAKQRK